METTHCSTGSFLPSDLVLSLLSRYEGSCFVSLFALLFTSACFSDLNANILIHFYLLPTSLSPVVPLFPGAYLNYWQFSPFSVYILVFPSYVMLTNISSSCYFVADVSFYHVSFLWHFLTFSVFAFFSNIPLLFSASTLGPLLFQSFYLFSCIHFSPVFLHLEVSHRLIHIWCASECLWQQDSVCGNTDTTCYLDQFIVGYGLLMGFVDSKKNNLTLLLCNSVVITEQMCQIKVLGKEKE